MSTKKITKKELTGMAAEMGLKGVSKLRKEELIHTIQIAEGNTDCFGKITECWEFNCRFAQECQA